MRFYGRDTSSTALPYCPLNSTGPCIGCDSADDRYVRVMNCTFVNTGRSGCGTLTEVFSGKHTLVDSLTSFTIPGIVRGGLPATSIMSCSTTVHRIVRGTPSIPSP